MSTLSSLFTKKSSLRLALPRQESLVVGLVLGLVVLAWTLESFLNPVIDSTDMSMVATMITKDRDGTLYPRDSLFAHEEMYRLYTPLYRWIVDQMWYLGGSFEAGLAWLVPFILTAYLLTTFILLRQITENPWIALALTVASAHYHDTMGAGVWGVGGSAGMMSRALFMPIIPILALFFLNYLIQEPRWFKGALLGLILGLMTNLHPVSGFHALMLLSACLILKHGHRLQGWLTLMAFGLATLGGAWSFFSNFFRNSVESASEPMTFEVFSRIVAERYSIFFFPPTFKWPLLNLELARPILDLLVWFYFGLSLVVLGYYLWGRFRWPGLERWVWLVGGLISVAYAYLIVLFDNTFIFLVVVFYLIYRFWRGSYPLVTGWLISLVGLVVLYSFVGYYFLSFIWQTFELWPLTTLLIEYARAARFVYLPIYLLAGLAGVTLVKEGKSYLGESTLLLSIAVALTLAITPTLTGHFANHLFITLLLIILALAAVPLMALIFTRVPSTWGSYLTIGLLVLVTFGPPASFLAGYLPIPARNLLQPKNWVPAPASHRIDEELYQWTRQNTSPEALFYGCFGSTTMSHFRRKAQRSITHNWKDLAFNVYHRSTLLPAYERFRQLEGSCRDFETVIEAARTIEADYILVSSQEAANFIQEACFVNERYAVFALRPEECGAKRL